MLKTLKKLNVKRKDNTCANPGCNNQVKRERNGTVLNYCSSTCQRYHYTPGSGDFDDELWETPTSTSGNVTSNQWGVWSPNKNDNPPPYSSIEDDDFDYENVTPLWEPDNTLTSNTTKSSKSSNPTDDFPVWLGSTVDPLWTPPKNNNSSRKNSSHFTPRSNSPSDDEEEIQCPACTFFIRPNKTVCEMCGTSVTRQEPKRSYNTSKSSKPKTTITSYRDLYGDEEEDDDDDLNPFADPLPRRTKQSSSSNNYERSSNNHGRSSNNYQRSSNNYERPSNNYERSSNGYERSSNDYERSSSSYNNGRPSRNRKSNDYDDSFYQTPTPPGDQLWIDDDDDDYPMDFRTSRPKSPEPKPYIYRDNRNTRERERNVQKPPTPPLNEKDNKVITCSACNFHNHPSMTHCEICFTQLNKTPERRGTTGRFEERAKKACSACSFYNDPDRNQCEMCYSPIAGAVRNPTTFNLPSLFKHDVNMTQCPICTFMNHPSMAQCEMCRNDLPGANVKQQQQQYQQLIDNLPGPVTKMITLPVDDHDYMTIQQLFRTGIPNARILAMFRMIMPARVIQAHETYKNQLARGNPTVNVTHRMFHGTQVVCDATRYYGPAGWKFCTAPNCGLCGIAQNGNSCARSRYGGRMWFANNSQTSLGYCAANPIKAMFVQDIISAAGGPIIIVDKEAATLVKYLILFQS